MTAREVPLSEAVVGISEGTQPEWPIPVQPASFFTKTSQSSGWPSQWKLFGIPECRSLGKKKKKKKIFSGAEVLSVGKIGSLVHIHSQCKELRGSAGVLLLTLLRHFSVISSSETCGSNLSPLPYPLSSRYSHIINDLIALFPRKHLVAQNVWRRPKRPRS